VPGNRGFRLLLSDEDSTRLREILAKQEAATKEQAVWNRRRLIFLFLALTIVVAGFIALGQTEPIRGVVSKILVWIINFFENALAGTGAFLQYLRMKFFT